MNLYQKYRPKTFDEVIGNDDIRGYFSQILVTDIDKAPHTYLFHGPTGCGKTSIARILAKTFGCADVDIREVNTADFRGIDTVRDMIKNSRYHAIGGGNRTWIIDECHKLTNDAQNALLKLLEDATGHAYFILCTTEPDKLIKPIRGRCIDLAVKPLNELQMQKLLKKVTRAEGKKIADISVYEQIIQDASGLPRNALQILDKVLNVPEEQQLEMAKASIGQATESIQLCRVLLEKAPWKRVANILDGLKDQDPESIRRHILGYCQSVLLKGENEKAAYVMEMFREPTYDMGFPGIILNCWAAMKG